MGDERGSIAFFATYRPPVPLDIYSTALYHPTSMKIETDGHDYNYNGLQIPHKALMTMLSKTQQGLQFLAGAFNNNFSQGDVSGLIFVSERLPDKLETLHVALRLQKGNQNFMPPMFIPKAVVIALKDLYPSMYQGVRMEDSPCFAGDRFLIFNSTMQPFKYGTRQPWNAVYRMDLANGTTVRLTPPGASDFSPSVSPCGKKVAVATLQGKEGGWTGEVEDLKTNIYVMNVEQPYDRKLVIKDGGWPSWGSSNILFFHRGSKAKDHKGEAITKWGVFRTDIRFQHFNGHRVTPYEFDAMTPAAIDENRVAVAVICQRLPLYMSPKVPDNYRHIIVFNYSNQQGLLPITVKIDPYADHYNPFVIRSKEIGSPDEHLRIGYSRCNNVGGITHANDRIKLEDPPNVGLYRVPGVFPTFTRDGKKLAFVDNDFQKVYLADNNGRIQEIFNVSSLKLPKDQSSVFSPVWNKNESKDTLYICCGPAFSATKPLHIYAITCASTPNRKTIPITDVKDYSNNAFPASNPSGTKIIFRSTRDWLNDNSVAPARPKNLYMIEESGQGTKSMRRITSGKWIDTHCDWSPNGQWIVFASTRDKPTNAPLMNTESKDPGYYAVYLMKASDTNVVVRVITSGSVGAGHVTHPMFSPDGDSICFSADLAAVSVEPISLPLFIHSARPYGDIFSIDINKNNIYANKDLTNFKRVTHSRYENSTPNWSMFKTRSLSKAWIDVFRECYRVTYGGCPFLLNNAQNMPPTHQLGYPKRCC